MPTPPSNANNEFSETQTSLYDPTGHQFVAEKAYSVATDATTGIVYGDPATGAGGGGGGAVTIADGANVTQGTSTDAAGAATLMGQTKQIVTNTTSIATSANQATANTSLSTIVTNTNKIPASPAQEGGNLATVVTNTGTTATGMGGVADAAYTSGSGSAIAVLKGVFTRLANIVTMAFDNTSKLQTSLYGKNAAAGDTALQVNSDGSQYMDLRKVGGIATQMSNSDGVNQANALEHALALYSNGPVDSTGKPQSLNLDRVRTWQGKNQASGAITSTTAGDTSLTFSSAPKTIMPGQAIQLSGAATPEVVYVTTSYTISSSATSIPLQAAVVSSGQTTAKWDQFHAYGVNNGLATHMGVLPTVLMIQHATASTGLIAATNSSTDGGTGTQYLEAVPGLYNGASVDRQRCNMDNISLVASAAYTTTQTGADQINYNGRGLIVTLDTTAASTGSVTLEIDMKDPVSGKYVALLTGAAVTTVSTNVYTVYPGATVTANVSASSPVPRTWRVKVTANNANSQTYSVGASVIV